MLNGDLYVVDDRLYKKLRDGSYRAFVVQKRKDYLRYYFLRSADKECLTINADKLHKLSYVDPNHKLEVVTADSVEEPNDKPQKSDSVKDLLNTVD
jgi:hypothetical protein